MVINTSSVGMSAQTTRKKAYTQKNATLLTNAKGEKEYSENSFSTTYESSLKNSIYTSNGKPIYELNNGGKKKNDDGIEDDNNEAVDGTEETEYIPSLSVQQKNDIDELLRQIREYMQDFRNRLMALFGFGSYYGKESDTINLASDLSGQSGVTVWNRTQYSETTYEEQEAMSFETKGTVKTADGRTIDFNMQVGLSRDFVEKSSCIKKDTVAIMTDPLVVSLGTNPIGVSDQKWQFDVDADGKEDNISLLTKGSGYLVYDKNEDGKINDGSEMFGSKTGNGFGELSEHDDDGNGWIDENDKIYDKLSVWVKNDAGEDKLINLKEAKIGAIYLGNVASGFTYKSEQDNSVNAKLKASGVYLTEDGNARTIGQLDMAKA